jgi:hypothetical protein
MTASRAATMRLNLKAHGRFARLSDKWIASCKGENSMASVKHILHREEIQGAGVMKENYGPDVPNSKGSFPGLGR